ncbi:hypothetical protein FOMPIDRAFT_1024189, partial [Fomitopsis schrenkii]
MALCSGCGKVFRYLDGDQCSKCRKREEADGDQALLQAIAKRSQCTGCGVLFLFLDDAICDVCKEKDHARDGRTAGAAGTSHASAASSSNAAAVPGRSRKSHSSVPPASSSPRRSAPCRTHLQAPRVLSGTGRKNEPLVLDDSDCEADAPDARVKLDSDDEGAMSLDDSIRQHRAAVSAYRGKNKSSSVPAASSSTIHSTAKFSKFRSDAQRAAAVKTATVTSSRHSLTFNCEVMLSDKRGKTVDTRLPAILLTMELNAPLEGVLHKVLEELNCKDGQWRKAYGSDAVVMERDICFAFKQKISTKYPEFKLRSYKSVRQFWDHHTQQRGVYFTDVQIRNFTPAIIALIDIERTQPVASDDGDRAKVSRKRKRQRSSSASPPPVKKERLDEEYVQVKAEASDEPRELPVQLPPKQRSRRRTPVVKSAPTSTKPTLPATPSATTSTTKPLSAYGNIIISRSIEFVCESPVLEDGQWCLRRVPGVFEGRVGQPLNPSKPHRLFVDADASAILGGSSYDLYNTDIDQGHHKMLLVAQLRELLSSLILGLGTGKEPALTWFLDVEVPQHYMLTEQEPDIESAKTVWICCPHVPPEPLD